MAFLAGKVVVITGASSGIGAALAVALGGEGATVVLAARRGDRLREVAGRVRSQGGMAIERVCDVSDRDQAERLVHDAAMTMGRLDILINNAGRGHFASVEDTTDEMIKSMFAVNVFSLWYTTRTALAYMKRQGSGHIINVASMAGKIGFPYNSAYVAAKHACVGFTHALRAELVETGIHASVVLPGGVMTEWAEVTEGGSMRKFFSDSGPLIKKIARERAIELPSIEGVIPPETVAARIVDCIRQPVAEVYTHRGSEEFVRLTTNNREEAERSQMPVILGERERYKLHKSK